MKQDKLIELKLALDHRVELLARDYVNLWIEAGDMSTADMKDQAAKLGPLFESFVHRDIDLTRWMGSIYSTLGPSFPNV